MLNCEPKLVRILPLPICALLYVVYIYSITYRAYFIWLLGTNQGNFEAFSQPNDAVASENFC